MSTLWQDIRYGVRTLRKNPGFTVVAVLTLALAIGANTAIFSLTNALLLKSLPGVEDPHQLVLVTDNGWPSLSYPLYERLREGSKSLSGLFVSPSVGKRMMTVPGSGTEEAEPVWNQAVSGDFFSVLGVSAAPGRTLTPNDDRPGDPQPVAVISYDFWVRRFGQDPAVIGKTITLEGIPLTIVGVTPREFSGFVVGKKPDLWWPVQLFPQITGDHDWLTSDGSQVLQIAGRLKPGVSRAQACEELSVVFQRMRLDQAERWGLSGNKRQDFLSHRIELHSAGTGFAWLRRDFHRSLSILMAIVGLVLLVACTNLAGLLLARGAARQREFSVRAALGAGRATLVRQLVTENMLLAGAGGLLGLILAQWGVQLLAHYVPGYGETVLLSLAPDLKILAFTVVVSVGAGLLFGLFPAWRTSRLDVVTALKDQANSMMGRRSGRFGNKALIVAQIALSCCLLIGAGLFVRTVQKLRTLDVGFDRENLLVFRLDLGKEYDDARQGDLYEAVLERVQSLPTVRFASMSNVQTLGGGEYGYGLSGEIRADGTPADAEGLKVRGTAVTLDYFQTQGIPVLMGRDFAPHDLPTTQNVEPSQSSRPVIIDRTSARTLFGNENPVGKLLRSDGGPVLEVIGVVGDVIHKGLRGGTRVSIYGLETCRTWALNFFHVRTSGNPLAAADSIRQVVRQLDPRVEVNGLRTMDDMVNNQLRRERMLSQLASFFSLSALALACLGLYGILSYAVARRTREIGVRMALGARKHNVLSEVIGQGMRLTLLGCLLGVILAVALTRVVSSLLYGVTPTDPLTFLVTVLLLGAVALLSCWLPARRAARIDPMEALRYE